MRQVLLTLSIARHRLAAVVVVAGGALVAASATSAAFLPQKLASSRVWRYGRPLVARNTAGDGVIVWRREEELNETLAGVEATTRPRESASWSPAVVLEATRQGGAGAPDVGIDSRGDAEALWRGQTRFEAATHPAAGSWSRPGFVSRNGLEGGESGRLAMGVRGEAKAVFDGRHRSLFTVALAVRKANGGWGASRRVAASKCPFQQPQIAIDARGEAVTAWVRCGSRSRIETLALGVNGRPKGPPHTVASRAGRVRELHLEVNAGGEAVLAWRLQAGSRRSAVEAASGNAGGHFTRPSVVSRHGDRELAAAIDVHDEAILLFTHTTQSGVETVDAVARRPGGRWSGEAPIMPGSETAEPQLSADPAGGPAVAVWVAGAPGAHTGVVEASVRKPDGSWQAPQTLSGRGDFSPSVAVSATGKATAAWLGEVPAAAGNETVEAVDFEAGSVPAR